MRLTSMAGPFGAFVDDLDAARLDPVITGALVDALFANRVLVMRGQALTDEQYVAFGRIWGEPILFFSPGSRHDRHPELIEITNSPSTPERLRDGAMHWHSDSSYEAVPASVTMLLAVEVPTEGNQTLFADTVAAYRALPSDLKERIADLWVVHDPRGGRVNLEGERRGSGGGSDLPVVEHPLVRPHPVTSEPALFGFSGTATGIVGWEDEPALHLLCALKRHVLQDRFRQSARAEVGSILVWDNNAVIHSATPSRYSDEDGQRRHLHRISTGGMPPAVSCATPATPAGADAAHRTVGSDAPDRRSAS